MPSPKISIITICYNEPGLERTCKSIVSQTFKDFEWIVIDGGSNVETLDIFSRYKNHMAYFVSEKDGGLYDAMNKGIAQARGEWLLFMNAGDAIYDETILEKISTQLDSENVDILYGGCLVEAKHSYVISPDTKEFNKDYFLLSTLPHNSSFIKRDLFDKHGNYRTDFRIISDLVKFAEFWAAGARMKQTDIVVSKFDPNGVSSTTHRKQVLLELARAWKDYAPWVFDIKNIKLKKYLFRFLRNLFFFGKLHKIFKHKYKFYREVIHAIDLYNQKYVKDRILFIAHSYHKKTRSCDFMIDYLRTNFDVDIYYDDSWATGEKFKIDMITKKYKHIIFWQNIPKRKIFKKIRHNNIIYFPMFDAVSKTKRYFRAYKKCKMVCFSKLLFDLAQSVGVKSMYIQYFPKPTEFVSGDTKKIFFWQRTSCININNVIKTVSHIDGMKIHLHTAIDPDFQPIMPRTEDEQKYQITHSTWFESKDDMINLMQECGIYVAPRMAEGIGMSFLEAMSMGKAVIANNVPTMSEYIENGINGYLVDFGDPKPIDMSNIEWVQKNAYESAMRGYVRWMNDREKIVLFIKDQKVVW